MYSLIKGFWDYYFETATYKVLIIGLDGSGKSVNVQSFEIYF